MRQTLLLFVGWGLTVVGALSLFGALLQGIVLLALGLYLLSFDQPWVRARRARLERRFPDAADWLAAGEAKARAFYTKVTGTPPDEEDQDRRGRSGRR